MGSGERNKSIRSIIDDERPVIRKSIVIGIGGSGIECVLSAKKMIDKNTPAGARRYVSWIGIDTPGPAACRRSCETLPLNSSLNNDIYYIPAPIPAGISPASFGDMRRSDSVYSWLPDSEVHGMPEHAGSGASRLRPVGRLAFFCNEESIREALIRERDRLAVLPEDQGRFRIMDTKGSPEERTETITFNPGNGVTRFYFRERIPSDHVITGIEPHQAALSILFPEPGVKPDISSFPCDERGFYFELNGDTVDDGPLSFDVTHVSSGAQVSVFIIASASGGTGSGMFLDVAAAVRDIFMGYRISPLIYGALLLPSTGMETLSTIGNANAYAALKEIDLFMSGTPFRADYPGGRRVEVPGRIFDDGMLYLFDSGNMAGISLSGPDQVYELAGEFISTFISSPAAGLIRDRIISDSPRSSVFLPADEKVKRRGNYSSFGLSRAIYPAEPLRELGYRLISIQVIDSLLKDADGKGLLETMGDIDTGLAHTLGLNSLSIFERMYPEYREDQETEMRICRRMIDEAAGSGEAAAYTPLIEKLIRDYSDDGIENRRDALIAGMERRYRVDLERIKTLISVEILRYIRDPEKGLIFAGRIIDLVIAKTGTYQEKYYRESSALERYSSADMEKLAADGGGVSEGERAEAVLEMCAFNYSQLIHESMLISAVEFLRELRTLLLKIKNDRINSNLICMTSLREIMKREVAEIRSRIFEKKSPMNYYLISSSEADEYIEKHFYSQLAIEELCGALDLSNPGMESDPLNLIEAYLISAEGIKILDLDRKELGTEIKDIFGDLPDKSADEVKMFLFGEKSGNCVLEKMNTEIIRSKLFRLIHAKSAVTSFKNISINEILSEKKIPLSSLLDKLDICSRPYLVMEATGLSSMEYYSVITNSALDISVEDDESPGTRGALPSRLNCCDSGDQSAPDLDVLIFETTEKCRPGELVSIGIRTGSPLFRMNTPVLCAESYHEAVSNGTPPLHIFNNPESDAKYFPDPMRYENYLNPVKVWSGLILLKILEERDGAYRFEDKLSDRLRDIEARENYRRVVLDLADKINISGGFDSMTSGLLAEAVNILGMLSKSQSDGMLHFRKEFSYSIVDLLEYSGTGDSITAGELIVDKRNGRNVKTPKFADAGGLVSFLESETVVREFVINSVRSVLDRTERNIRAGADISLPKWKVDQSEPPAFKDRLEFYNYYEKRGSLEWQNIICGRLVDRLDEYIASSRFRLDSDPSQIDRAKTGEFLRSLDQRMPDAVLREVKVRTGILK